MAELTLQLFGGFALRSRSDDALHVPPGKARVLLAYLAQRPGRAYSRAHLADFLWGGHPERAARHSLSQALSTLRRSMGATVGATANDPEMIAVDPHQVRVDVAEFRALAERTSDEALSRAAALYRSPFAGLDLDQPDVEDWLAAVRLELEEQAIQVYERLLSHARDAGDPMRTKRLARELLAIDPAAEAGHRALIASYAAEGDNARAVEQYRICQQRLHDELGVMPSPETEDLLRRLRAARTARGPGSDEAAAPGPTLLLAPVTPGGSAVDRALLDGVLGDLAAELTRFRPVRADPGTTSIGEDSAEALAQLSAERGLDYGLGLILRHRGDKTRLEATLVRAADASVVCRAPYEFGLSEVLDPGPVAAPIAYHLERDWLDSVKAMPEEAWSAYAHFLRGAEIYFGSWNSPETSAQALRYFETAVSLGLELTQARPRQDSIYTDPVLWPGHDLEEFTAAFFRTAERALTSDPGEPSVHRMMGLGYLHLRRFDAAQWHFSRGLRDNPNDADLNAAHARFLTHVGEPRRALAAIQRARRLNPIHPDYFWESLALPLYALGHYEEALAALRKMRRTSYHEHLYMAACQSGLEDHAAARRSLERALTEMPDLRLSAMHRLLPYREPTLARRIGSHLTAAGLPK